MSIMDPIRNPYTPGAGTPPPELAGRDELRDDEESAHRKRDDLEPEARRHCVYRAFVR